MAQTAHVTFAKYPASTESDVAEVARLYAVIKLPKS